MIIENTGKRTAGPTHPGEMLREDFLPDCPQGRRSVGRLAGARGGVGADSASGGAVGMRAAAN